MTKQLTIRGVDERLHAALRNRADQQGLSVNRYVLYVLKENVGLAAGKTLRETKFDDLDYLAGTWNQADLDEFNAALDEQRSIDEELWQ